MSTIGNLSRSGSLVDLPRICVPWRHIESIQLVHEQLALLGSRDGVFAANDGGMWRVGPGSLLVCQRSEHFLVAVALGDEPVRLPAGTALLSAVPLNQDGWLQPNNAAWVLRG